MIRTGITIPGQSEPRSNGNVGLIGPVGRVFAIGPGDLGSIPGRIIPKTKKMVLDIEQYKVRI